MLLKDKLADKELILASKSPRRQELMRGCGLEFTIADGYEVEESYPEGLDAYDIPLYLAELKSNAYPYELSDRQILVTADTVVVIDDQILEKPKDRQDALNMLFAMSGKKHTVVTGVAIRGSAETNSFTVRTDVWFRSLREEEMQYYVDNYKPYDKAGAYGIQEWIGYVGIGRIEGSFYNVMGLPIQSLYVNLERFVDCM